MNTATATDKDKQMAQRCLTCPVCSHARNSMGSLIGLSRISRMAYAHTARHMRWSMGKRPIRLDRGETDISRSDSICRAVWAYAILDILDKPISDPMLFSRVRTYPAREAALRHLFIFVGSSSCVHIKPFIIQVLCSLWTTINILSPM